MFAKRALKIGEEITVDYQPFNLSLTQEQCQCKSNNCRKVIPTSTDKYISSPSQSNVSNNPNQNSDNITISALTQSNGFVTLDELAACMKHFLLSSSCSDNLKIYFTNALGVILKLTKTLFWYDFTIFGQGCRPKIGEIKKLKWIFWLKSRKNRPFRKIKNKKLEIN